MLHTQTPAPGARALIRNEEWLVKSTDPSSLGGHQLTCIGLSETVRDRTAMFLTGLETVTLLDPAKTELVFDVSSQFIATRLLVEARLRQATATGDRLVLGHRAVMDSLPFQLVPAHRVLSELRPRLLIADTTGVGKTLEAGILAAELARRGRARRILVVTTKSMMKQLQGEFWNRFTIPLTRLNSAGIARIRREIPTNHNPFHHYDRTIISIDTLKRDSEYRAFLEAAWWDLIIIDEAHNASFKGNRTQNNRLATLLAERSDALILLTATPHNGRKDSFASLMRMLDPTVLPQGADYTRQDVEHLFVRRMKKDIREQLKTDFPDREVHEFKTPASAEEDHAYSCLANLKLASDAQGPREGEMLFRTTLEKALFSSPAACLETLRLRLKKQEAKGAAHPDNVQLQELAQLVEQITPAAFSKYGRLLEILRADGNWKWDGRTATDRLVIFTERIATLNFLEKHLPAALDLPANAVAKVHGALSDVELQQTVEDFGKTNSPLRLLLASDVASEGLNLHYQSFRLLHFDIPWSLMVFQQRNGRIDRYGQSRTPRIGYLMTVPSDAGIRGDLRILEILIEKDKQAALNIGDPSSFLGLYDEEKEELRVAEAIENDEDPARFAALLESHEGDVLDLLFGPPASAPATQPAEAQTPLATLPTVFDGDYQYARDGLRFLHTQSPGTVPEVRFDNDLQCLSFQPDKVLGQLLKRELADEMWPADNQFTLSAEKAVVLDSIAAARDGSAWPQVQYLWPLHPVLIWLDFKLLAQFGRQRAPVARVARGLKPGEAIVLILAQVPNRRGQAMLTEWLGVPVGADGAVADPLRLEQLLERTGFGAGVSNDGQAPDFSKVQAALPQVLEVATKYLRAIQKEFKAQCDAKLDKEVDKLAEYQSRHQAQLTLALGELATETPAARRRKLDIDKLFEEYREWVEQTLQLDERAQFTVVAVLTA